MALHFDLVSPERLLVSETVESVVMPGSEGYLTVLAGHAPLMTTLKPGVVEVRDEAGAVRRIFVRGGFADVNGAGLTILADEAIRVEDLDSAALDRQIAAAEESLENFTGEYDQRVSAATRLNDLRDVRRWIMPA